MVSPSTPGSSFVGQVLEVAKGKQLIITCWSIVSGMAQNWARFTALPLLSF